MPWLITTRQRSLVLLIALMTIVLLYLRWNSEALMSKMKLPRKLEGKVLQRFDELVGRKELFYTPSAAEHFEDEGFQFELRIAPILKEKPISPPADTGRNKPGGSFINPTPSEIITTVGPSHRLLLNKFSIYRPMLVLPTIKYIKQTSDLDLEDIAAVWAVIKVFSTQQVATYNCGINSGSSQGHKHVQIFPQPDSAVFKLWPGLANSSTEITSNIPKVPFKHFVLQIPTDATAEHIFLQYQRLLKMATEALRNANQEHDYNVALTTKWIVLIPRSRAEWRGPFGANAQGMLGLVSVRDEEEKERWAKLGWVAHLRELGIHIMS